MKYSVVISTLIGHQQDLTLYEADYTTKYPIFIKILCNGYVGASGVKILTLDKHTKLLRKMGLIG